jgi:MFS family permease
MPATTLIITFVCLIVAAGILRWYLALSRNVVILFLIQPLAMSVSPVIVFIGGILSSELSPDPKLATLPLTLMIIGIAVSAVPAAMLSKQWGRKRAFTVGLLLSFSGSITAMFAALWGLFSLFLIASAIVGCSLAFAMQYRFAAIDSVHEPNEVSKVVSALMFTGIFAAFIGPEIALIGKDWLPSPHGYAGSFLALAGLTFVALIIFSGFTNPAKQQETTQSTARPLAVLIKQPLFIIAILSAAIGYGLMSLLMTATPISMHTMQGHLLTDTKWVIQSHIAAMYLPSLVSGYLVQKFGIKQVMLLGILMFAGVTLVALQGQQVMHYWWALVLLGVGWNFLFLTGTVLLSQSYTASEKHKMQALNDLLIFSVQATASLLAGWIIFSAGWHTLVLYTMPFIAVVLLAWLKLTKIKLNTAAK